MKILVMMLALVVILVAPLLALAQEVPLSDAELVTQFVSNVLFPFLTVLLVIGAGWVILWLKKTTGIQISITTEEMLLGFAKQGVAYAEELAARKLKESGIKLPGPEILQVAMRALMEKAPKITEAQAERLVHTALGMISGAGASGDRAVR